MPYIIMKRNDIPDGTLQVLDMEPNVSQRNLTLDPPGQTKYVNAVENDTVVTTGTGPIVFHREARGLAAWFITNVNDGTGVAASGSYSIAAGNAADGDTLTIDTTAVGGPSVVLTFRAAPATPDEILIGGTEDASATNAANAINNPLNGLTPYVVAAAPGGGPPSSIDITAVNVGTAGNSITLASSGANLTPAGPTALAGGADANALTAADANANAAAVLALYAFGDLTSAAGTLQLADINGALVTGTITATQYPDVMSLLAGRKYVAPRGVQVDLDGSTFDVQPPVGSEGGPGFIAESNRDLFLNDGLPLSFVVGELSEFTSNDFVYAGVPGDPNGEAVVVYNDDGTLFTP